jgi:adenine-specific DNA-methyltransferase
MPDLRQPIQSALQAFTSQPLRKAALSLLDTLGYRSDRTLVLEGSKPQAFLELVQSQATPLKFDPEKALFSDWKSADILFQLTDDDLAAKSKETDIQSGLLRSYLFFAIELKGADYARGKLSAIARQINRVFPMPVMVLLKHGGILSIAVINRRQNKVHTDKDVLEKVTLIRDISLASPHRGHLDILQSFSLSELEHPKKLPIRDFDTLHAAWELVFNIELLNNRFYKELSNWYFWALPKVDFPDDLEKDDEKRRATGLIRLLTRLIFCWFAARNLLLA